MKHLAYGIKFIINHQILKKTTPLICGLVLHNKCNLRCRHCNIPGRGAKKLSFEETTSVISSFYKKGGRTLYLEGGEPFIWRDGSNSIEDVVTYSHKIGYYATVIYTNGTIPINTSADTVFISIDGLQKTHDFLRGESFNKIEKNILESSHPSLYINYTINNFNKDEIERFCLYINEIQQIRGIFFYFHTPYYGYDELYLEPTEKNKVLHKLLKYKNKYKILNSRAGLKCALKNDWKRPLNICQVYEKGTTYNCCRFSGDPELCRNCGYLSYAEIHQTLNLKPSAILNALKYF
ncbi:radical SAM protein [candidate division KSB1 bacterium]|nr:radical SAM protein [candidate division KSB1 bacterium]MBL7095860.1 radical SAM protein [candidate division KSB1 bacterium]